MSVLIRGSKPVRSDHLHTEVTNSVIGCGEY